MKKPPLSPADEARGRYLELCDELMHRTQSVRNYAMKPGNVWLARAELAKISGLISELESRLDEIKQADEA
jgi:hypothetical protein